MKFHLEKFHEKLSSCPSFQLAPAISVTYIASQPISLNIHRNKKGMEQNLQTDECNARRFPKTTTRVFHKS